ncbi:MAG: spore maturation protein [Flavobacteriales bacterium]|nr:spore maturation protein [Flavobacteriales bacterium]
MALHYIFAGFFVVAFLVAILRLVGYYFREFFVDYGMQFGAADLQVFPAMVQSTFDMAETSISIVIYLIGIMALWLGIMKIGEAGGAINILSRAVAPFFRKLFPELPKDHPAMGSMMMNFSANMLGLDNAATPLGLKAMNELQEANTQKDTATNAQIMFLVLNTSGLTLIPVSVMALRAANGAANPSDVFLPILLATFFATLAGLISVAIYQKINLFDKTILAYLGGLTAFIIGFIYWLSGLPQEQVSVISSIGGNFLLFSVIVSFIWMALRKKVNIYESFVDGAKEGFGVAVKIIPYLVAMLVAIGVFRASGALDLLVGGLSWIVSGLGFNADFVGAMPTAFMKPLSGSGARGMMVEAMTNYGPDSFVGRLASVFQGSTETTFYTLAVYFGAVNVSRTRYTVVCGLIADAVGITAAIFISYLFFH